MTTLAIVPATAVRPDQPRWWCGSAPEEDHDRIARVRSGEYQLNTLWTAEMFAFATRVPIESLRAIVEAPELPPTHDIGGEAGWTEETI